MENEHVELKNLLNLITANQQSLHDDMVAVVDRLAKLETEVIELIKSADQPAAIDETQLYLAARALVVETERCSTSYLQRIFRISYSWAARLVDALEESEIVGPADGTGPRKILMTRDSLVEIEEKENEALERQWEIVNSVPNHLSAENDVEDDLYEDAKQTVIEAGKASTSYLQRKLRIGYSAAAQLMDLLEENGVIGPADGSKPRDVLIDKE